MKDSYKMIPYGISNYKTIATKNYAYIDKTRYIEQLERVGAPYLFFLRPRRFGKSLFTSVLNCYYDVSEKDHFDTYFGDTYIGQHPTENRNSYMMLNFNFSGIDTEPAEEFPGNFRNRVRVALEIFLKPSARRMWSSPSTKSPEGSSTSPSCPTTNSMWITMR
ncbi:MAG: AAA family ATPase [Lachnospiraceae bacterium]|nr:AAA family ATPase [Lachnospiraceae bacterium]